MMTNRLKLLLALPIVLLLAACGGAGSSAGDAIVVGAEAPDFTLPEALGGEVSLSDYDGQPVLLYFHMANG